MDNFRREIKFIPAWDKGPKYGKHSMEIHFYLYGDKGMVQFKFATHWYLDTARSFRANLTPPYGVDVGYHSPTPMYDGQEAVSDDCPFLGGTCYYDGSGLLANDYLEILIQEGDESVWGKMEQYYKDRFNDVPTL